MATEPLTLVEMRRIDKNCVGLGISLLQLMENAGSAVARCTRNTLRSLALSRRGTVAVICGLGNNGGDGFVAARHLSRDCDVSVVLIGDKRSIKTEEARINWRILQEMDTSIAVFAGRGIFNPESPLERLDEFDVLLDGIFGTGIRGTLQEREARVIQRLNSTITPKIAIDVPSGYGTDRVVKADYTVVLHRPKVGVALDTFEVVDIGIPIEAEIYTGPGDVQYTRRAESHKGDNGRVLVIGGGPYTGAPSLSAMAALRSGVDVVTVASPRADVIAGYSPNLIVKKVGHEKITAKDVDDLAELINTNDSVVMGPGLGADPETIEAVGQLIPMCNRLALDADGLTALPSARFDEDSVIITPHQGEFARLTGEPLPVKLEERIKLVRLFSRDHNVVTLLKGHIDIISDGSTYRLNKTGNPGMTVGGTGDVLVGIVGAFSTWADRLRAASSAAYVNGLAGDRAFEQYGYSLLATDVIKNIPKVLIERNVMS